MNHSTLSWCHPMTPPAQAPPSTESCLFITSMNASTPLVTSTSTFCRSRRTGKSPCQKEMFFYRRACPLPGAFNFVHQWTQDLRDTSAYNEGLWSEYCRQYPKTSYVTNKSILSTPQKLYFVFRLISRHNRADDSLMKNVSQEQYGVTRVLVAYRGTVCVIGGRMRQIHGLRVD